MRDNRNYFVHGRDEQLPLSAEAYAVYAGCIARFVSYLWGVIALVGAYLAGLQVFASRQWAGLAVLLFALTPQMLQLSSVFSNDAPTAAFGAILLWQLLWIVNHRANIPRLILLGLLLGGAGLVKVNSLLLVAPLGVAVIVEGLAQRRAWLHIILRGLLVAVIALLVLSPWLWYGWTQYRSPLGLDAHQIFQTVGTPVSSMGEYLIALIPVFGSYWGRFGGGSVWLPMYTYALYTGLCILAAIGYVVSRRSLSRNIYWRRQGVVLISMCLVFAAGLMYWLFQLSAIRDAIQGRLAYAAHAAICIVITGGIYLLVKRLPRWNAAAKLVITALSLYAAFFTAPLALVNAYRLPAPLDRSSMPLLSGPTLIYNDAIRLLGTRIEQPKFDVQRAWVPLTTCWQILQKPPVEAVLAIKLLTAEGQSVGDRTMLFGLGRYPTVAWEPGYQFCDTVDTILRGPFEPGRVYDVAVYVLN